MNVSIRLFALYFSSRAQTVKSESRQGRVIAYSATRRTASTPTSTAKVGTSANRAYPTVISSGTETSMTRRPTRLKSLPKRNNCVNSEQHCTQKSTSEKKRVRSSALVKTFATKACCCRYRNVDTQESRITN